MSGLNPGVIGSMIPIVAIVAGAAIALVVLWFRHRERIAMIEMGMHPDAKDPDELESGEADELEPSRRLRGSADR